MKKVTDDLLSSFTERMRDKIDRYEKERGITWEENDWYYDWIGQLEDALEDGDWISVANYAMFGEYHGWKL